MPSPARRQKGTWDAGVNFDQVLRRIMKIREYAKTMKRPRLLRAMNVALIQITNGLRISEAVECYYKFLLRGDRELEVRVRKTKDKYRLCVVPDVIDATDIAMNRKLPPASTSSIRTLIYLHLNVNTHSLRYAFINKLLEKGVDLPTISKIVGHRKLETLLTYVQEKRARAELLDLVKSVGREVRR